MNAVITPKILYGSQVWHKETFKGTIVKKLQRLTRLALIQMTPCRTKSPTAGLQILTGTIPLHLKARLKNLMTLLRLSNYDISNIPDSNNHLGVIKKDFVETGVSHCLIDQQQNKLHTQALFKTIANGDLPSPPVQPWVQIKGPGVPPTSPSGVIAIYTDGSKKDQKDSWGTGCGVVIYDTTQPIVDTTPLSTASIALCHTKTVFMAEVEAIHEGLLLYHKLRTLNNISRPQAIYIFSDSQSAIQALSSITLNYRTVEKYKHLFNATAAFTPVYLQWVKAHVGNVGNEKADALAKAGAATEHTHHCASPRDLVPLSFVKTILRDWLIDIWTHWWIIENPCRQTKIWFPLRKANS